MIERTLAETFANCGSWGYLDLLVGVAGLALGVRAAVAAFQGAQAERRSTLAVFALGMGGVALVGGFAAYLHGIHQMELAIAAVDPEIRSKIEVVGRREALSCIWIGVGLWIPVTLLAGAALIGVGITQLPPEPPASADSPPPA